jgi:N12 class adenine-specific DNA methylase
MPNLSTIRSKFPQLSNLDDQTLFETYHQVYHPEMDAAQLASRLGYTPVAPPAPAVPQAGLLRTAGDVGIKLAQGAVDLGASAVGLGSLATGGLLGQGMRAIGYDPKTTNAMLGEYLSDSQKASDDKVQQADGFMNTLAAAANNPRAILGSVAESAPGMLAGMGVTSAVARGIAAKAALATVEGAAASAAELAAGRSAAHATQAALGTNAGKAAASDAVEAAGAKLLGLGAATEGAQSAGQIADDAQAAGRAWSDYALPAVAAGTLTAGIGYGAGRLMGDSATRLATGARSTGVKGNMAARLGKEAFSEGVLEEMPQSAQEQYFTNIAQGEADLGKGVANAAATGMLVGGAMGAGMGVMQPHHASPTHEPVHVPAPEPVQLQNSGPLSQAANAGQAAAAAIQAQATPATPPAIPPTTAVATNTPAPLSLAQIDARMAELVAIGHGKKAQKTWDADGNLIKQPAIVPRRLTPQEIAEYQALEQARADRTAIPPEQQAEYEALLSDEQAAQEQKWQQAKQAAAAERAAQEDAQLNAMLAEEQAQRDAQARQAEHEAQLQAEQQAAQQAQITNAIVEHDNRQRAEANRAALRSAVLNDQTIAPERKKPAFLAALRRDGYINPQLTPDDHHEIDLATTPVKGLPNELVDAVPERKEAPKPDARAPNLKAVDDAIAAGMRLRTTNGAVLHKKGSSKIFRLSQEQKAYYLKQMAKPAAAEVADPQLETAPQAELPQADLPQSDLPPQSDGQAQVKPAIEKSFEPEPAPPEPPQGQVAQPDSVITIPHDIDHDWHMLDDIKTRGHSQDGWQWVGQNLNGHDLFEKDGQRRVIEGDTAITESPNKRKAHRVVEFRTQDEVRAAREALNLPVPVPQANNSDTTKERQSLNRKTVKDMSNDDLLRARVLLADHARAPKIEAEIKRRGLDEVAEADQNAADSAADLAAESVANTPTDSAPAQPTAQSNVTDNAPLEASMPTRDQIMAHYAQLLAQDGIKNNPLAFYQKFADAVLAKDAYALKWLANGLNNKGKKAFEWATGVKLPRTQNGTWNALKTWAGISEASDAAANARAEATRIAKRQQEDDEMAEREAARQLFRRSKQDDTLISGKEVIDARIAEGFTEIRNISKSAVPKYVLANEASQQYYVLDRIGRTYAQAALRRLAANTQAQSQIVEAPAVASEPAAPATTEPAAPANEATTVWGQDNKLFTANLAEQARAILKAKLRQINMAVFDPELLAAGITLAGFHIEAGARTFAKYSRAMLADLGPEVQPFLRSFYEGVRHFPDFNTKGMTSEADLVAAERIGFDEGDTLIANGKTRVIKEVNQHRIYFTDGTSDWYSNIQQDRPRKVIEAALPGQNQAATEPTDNSATISPEPPAKGETNEHTPVPRQSTPPLGDLAPQEDPRTQASGGIRASAASGSSERQSPDSGTDATPVLPGARSGRSGIETVHPAGTGESALRRHAAVGARTGRRNGREGSRVSSPVPGGGSDGGALETGRLGRVARTPSRSSEVASRGGVEQATSASAIAQADTRVASTIPAINFRITDDIHLGQGGEVAKFNDNLNAIRALRTIELENRRASPMEQAQLARYVGWGGLANAFPAPETGEYKPAWATRGPELAQLLTPKEYAQARRSTLDAHYTSQTVVSAMWQAVQRLGFAGGLVLEPSSGSGNFIGLLPKALHGHTRFIGVELDSLTARIAAKLYPQETILNTGFQKVPLPDDAFDLAIGNPPFGDQSLRFQFKPELNGHSIHNQFFLASLDAVKPGGLLVQVVSRYLLDKKDNSSRTMLAKKARLLAAIRLPDTAFKENARTEVVTDILFLQRFTSQEESDMAAAFAALASKRNPNMEKEQERQTLASQVPAWIDLATIADPLGGEPIEINQYFTINPHMIIGVMERTGPTGFRSDVTVRLESHHDLAEQLQATIQHVPEAVIVPTPDAITAAVARHQDMSAALHIALAGDEQGALRLEPGNVLVQVIERETPEGGHELSKRTLSPASPWSDRLFQDALGRWYSNEVVLDDDGKPVKEKRGDKTINRNVVARKVYATEADIPASLLLGQSRFERLQKLVGLRDLLVEQLNREADNSPADVLEQNRQSLARQYRAFTSDHGLINDPANAALLNDMPDGALILALEFGYRPAISSARAAKIGDQARPSSANPAPILSRRVIVPYIAPASAQSFADALSITLAEQGKVDMARLAELLGMTEPELAQRVQEQEKPLIFQDPESERWETRNDYLSGEVRRKLNAARAAGLQSNIAALETVQPEPWTSEDVTVLLGSTWVPTRTYEDFIFHISGVAAKVTFSQLSNQFHVRILDNQNKRVNANEDEWSADGYSSVELIEALLDNDTISVTYKASNGATVLDREKTDLANLKARAIAKEFEEWAFANSERRNQLVELFNDKFNTRVNRQYDGSHLVLPGKVPDSVTKMRRHQKNAIWRGVYERFLMLDHAVGAGKTYTSIAIAMERRRMGLSQKPLIVVPNHMIEQFTADAYRLYPGAKVLAASKDDMSKERRRRLFAKIATGDFDLIIMAHSSFGFIGIAPETEERFLQVELKQALDAVKEAEDEAQANGHTGFRKPFGVKEAERLVEKITNRLEKVKTRKDKLLTFEQLGIDHLTIDEAHEFKNLFYSSRLTGVRGMNNKLGSQKALDLYNKVRVLRESPTGGVMFMTGTPISNSAVEMYTMMRYLAANELKELGLEHFDAWRAQYVSADAGWEPNETGRLAEVVRLGRTWSNMRSLMDLYYSFTDSVDNDAIKRAYAEDNHGAAFPIPRVMHGDRQSVIIQPTDAQIELLGAIINGFDSLPEIEDPYERNKERLKLMDRARKVSLDVRAVAPTNPSLETGGKLDRVADEVARIYKKWDDDRGTQLVFLDRSVAKSKGDNALIREYDALRKEQTRALQAHADESTLRRIGDKLDAFDAIEIEALRNAQNGGWNAYQQIKDNLLARGIPAHEIRFVQEANTDEQKQALFDAVNDGAVRVLIGSTPRMGAGTNVQQRLVALHHVDVTWKPSDIEQREGRIIRQGNRLLEKYGVDQFEVEILAYATERTIDAKMWSLNAAKLKTINGIRKYDGAFVMEFEDEESVSMAELAALASGDPLLLERVKLMSELDKLELLKRQYLRKQRGVTDKIEQAERDIARLPGQIEQAEQDRLSLLNGFNAMLADVQSRRVVVEGVEYDQHHAAQQAVLASIARQQNGNDKAKFSVSVEKRRLTSDDGAMRAISDALGDANPFASEIGQRRFGGRTDAARAMWEDIKPRIPNLNKQASESVIVGQLLGLPLDISIERGEFAYYASLSLLRLDGSTLASTRMEQRDAGDFHTSIMRGALDYLLRDLERLRGESTITWMQSRLQQANDELPQLLAKKGSGFPEQDQIDTKFARLNQVISELSTGKHAALIDDAANSGDAAVEESPKLSQAARPELAQAGLTHTVQSLIPALSSSLHAYGADFLGNLLATGKLRLIDSDQASTLLQGHDDGAQAPQAAPYAPVAFFNPQDGVTYLIADAISRQASSSALHGLMLHELANHALHLGRATREFKQLLNYFALMKNGNPKVQAAFARAEQVGSSKESMNEEALGYYLEANPELSFAQKVIAWFRSIIRSLGQSLPLLARARWFRAVGMMSAHDLVYAAQRALQRAPQKLAAQHPAQSDTGTKQSATQSVTPAVAFSQAEQASWLISLWKTIAGHEDAYQYPVSHARNLIAVMHDIMPKFKVQPLPETDAKARTTASKQWVVTMEDGKQAFVYEFGRDLQIDASRLLSGSSRGSALYAAVANYAFNTGKVLEGDSAGFSEVAQMRRLENMISTAMKFGTTDHIRPHALQRDPKGPIAKRLGMKGLSWAVGLDQHNLAQMLKASYDYVSSLLPEINHVHLTEYADFTGERGELLGDIDFQKLAARATDRLRQRSALSGTATTAAIGSATIKRAAITGTVLRSESREDGRALLGRIGTELHANIGQAEHILYSRGLAHSLSQSLANAANNVQELQLPAGFVVGDLFNQSGKLNWWHKTIGTMDNLARRQPAFARVYHTIQRFLGDVSRYAVVAADEAPTLLPKLENMRDILGSKRKKPLTAADTQAIAAPIFEGTLLWTRDDNGQAIKISELESRAEGLSLQEKLHILMQKQVIDAEQNRVWQRMNEAGYTALIEKKFADSQLVPGIVWTNAELRDLFRLNEAQIGMYREFRAAIDKSLTNLTISEMVKMGGKDAKPLLDAAMKTANLQEATTLLLEHFQQLAEASGGPDNSGPAKRHLQTAQTIANLAGRAQELMQRGYAPLSRFGRFAVYVQENGEQLYFGLFETAMEAAKMARTMRASHPDAEISQGTLSEDAYKLFAGISPETIELFGSMVGLDTQTDAASTKVYQKYLQLAKSNRSALKRMITRKGIAGFSEDAGRVLASFVYSNARLTAGNVHLGEIDEAVTSIPKEQGQLIDAAMQLREHIRNPESGGTMLGGLMFAQFLGGSVASAMVNLTQPLTMTLPYLSQFGGITKASERLMTAVRDARKDETGDAKLDAALQWASDEGIVAPQEVHYLQAQAAGRGALQSGDGTALGDARAQLNNAIAKVMVGWGKLFAIAELSNRRITFIAAWRTAVAEGFANPAGFARQAVAQTQGVYNSGNKPRWARSSLGGLLMTFKQYSIAYVELLSRMAFAGSPGSPQRAAGRRGALYMLAVLFLMSGMDGLPFEKNLEDLMDGLLQRLGYNFSTKRQKQAFFTDVLGSSGADFAIKGISSLPGMPIDVAGRLGMGNLIPATGLLTKKMSYTQDLGELAGPAGDIAKRAFSGVGKLLDGDLVGAALDVSPQSVRNLAKGADMMASGQYKDARGYKVNDVTPLEGIMKMVGFQPNSTANIQDAKGQALNMIAQTRMRSTEIAEHLAQGIASGDVAMQREARAWRDDWNRKNPETPIKIDMPGVAKRVRAMREDVILRTQHTAPKALKLAVRKELAQ